MQTPEPFDVLQGNRRPRRGGAVIVLPDAEARSLPEFTTRRWSRTIRPRGSSPSGGLAVPWSLGLVHVPTELLMHQDRVVDDE